MGRLRAGVVGVVACAAMFLNANRVDAAVIGDWMFDEGSGASADSSVGGHTGTLVNFADTSAGAGDVPSAEGWTSTGGLNFTTAPGRVETSFPLNSLIGQSFTVEYTSTHLNANQNWSPFIGQSGGCCFFIGKQNLGSQLHANLNGLGGITTGTVPVADGQEHHVALVFNDTANTMSFYFDHTLAGTVGAGGTLNDQGNLWFGGVAHAAGEQWNGAVDRVRISDEALTPSQFFGAAAQPGVDLTEANGVQSKYVVGLGRIFSDTVINGVSPMGVVDYSLGRGNGTPFWQLNDGNGDQNLNSFAATAVDGDDFVGYLFKVPVRDLSQVSWINRVFGDGGTFDSQPRVEILTAPLEDGGVWQQIGVTFNTPYDRGLGGQAFRPYTITPDDPNLTGVWGIRLAGPANADNPPGADPDGFIASSELNFRGQIDLPIDFNTNLAHQSNGGIAFMNQAQTGNPAAINDGDLFTREQTFGAGATPEDFFGVTWDEAQDQVRAVGVTFKRFGDGGLFDPATPPRIEYTLDGSTWISAPGLDLFRYEDVASNMVNYGFGPEQAFLFTFDELSDIVGIRAIGAPEGSVDGNGFVGVFEFEVFGSALVQAQIPEPATGTLAVIALALLGGRLTRRRRA